MSQLPGHMATDKEDGDGAQWPVLVDPAWGGGEGPPARLSCADWGKTHNCYADIVKISRRTVHSKKISGQYYYCRMKSSV